MLVSGSCGLSFGYGWDRRGRFFPVWSCHGRARGFFRRVKMFDIQKRFWSKVDKSGSCWVWKAGKFPNGYGSFWMNGKSIGAHTCSWRFHFGKVPPGKYVLHSCDNPSCVNPEHLFLGTHGDNMKDKATKGRQTRGIDVNTCKLSESDVIEIRNLFLCGIDQLSISSNYGVSRRTINHIVNRKTWKDIP